MQSKKYVTFFSHNRHINSSYKYNTMNHLALVVDRFIYEMQSWLEKRNQ